METTIYYESKTGETTEETISEDTVNFDENGIWILSKEKVKIKDGETSKEKTFIPYRSIAKVVMRQ